LEVACAQCKTAAMDPQLTEADALDNAERCHGYIVFGKFHFCAGCLNNATERWKANNRELLEACKCVAYAEVDAKATASADSVDFVVNVPPVPKKRGRPRKERSPDNQQGL